MRLDPINILFTFLSSHPDVPEGAVTGTMVGREPGETTILLKRSGGYRAIRDRMDRADVEYDVYALEQQAASDLADLVSALLLEELPNLSTPFGRAEVLDVEEISIPQYYPDSTSREHMYGGEITLFYVAA